MSFFPFLPPLNVGGIVPAIFRVQVLKADKLRLGQGDVVMVIPQGIEAMIPKRLAVHRDHIINIRSLVFAALLRAMTDSQTLCFFVLTEFVNIQVSDNRLCVRKAGEQRLGEPSCANSRAIRTVVVAIPISGLPEPVDG